MQEIERKFLVKNDQFKKECDLEYNIFQGYLCFDPDRTVRVRITADECTLTIKGKSSSDGLSRYEFEKVIDRSEAEQLLDLCDDEAILKKIRYVIIRDGLKWEVDEFYGFKTPLTIAEVELDDIEQTIDSYPEWLGEEVTGDVQYYNSVLINKRDNI